MYLEKIRSQWEWRNFRHFARARTDFKVQFLLPEKENALRMLLRGRLVGGSAAPPQGSGGTKSFGLLVQLARLRHLHAEISDFS